MVGVALSLSRHRVLLLKACAPADHEFLSLFYYGGLFIKSRTIQPFHSHVQGLMQTGSESGLGSMRRLMTRHIPRFHGFHADFGNDDCRINSV